MEAHLYGLTPADVRHIVYSYCGKINIKNNFNKDKQCAGKNWFIKYVKRYKEHSVRSPESTSIQRAIGFNRQKVERFYEILQKILFTQSDDRNTPPENVYNVNETGFSICRKPHKINARKEKRSVSALVSAEKCKI